MPATTTAPAALPAIRRALRLATPAERRHLTAAAALGAVAGLSGTALLALSGYLIARAAEQPPVLSLTVAIVCVRGFGILRAVTRYAERLVGHDVVLGTLARLRADTFARLVPRVPGAVGGRSSAQVLDGLVADVDRVQDVYLRSIAPLLAGAVVAMAAVVAATIVLPAAGAVVLLMALVLGVGLPSLARWAGRGAAARIAAARAQVVQDVTTTLDAAAELVMSGSRDRHARRVAASSEVLARAELRAATRDALVAGTATAVTGLGTVAMLAVALLARADGVVGPTSVGLLALLAIGAGEALGGLPQAARELDAGADAIARVDALGTAAAPQEEPGSDVPADATVHVQALSVVRDGRVVLCDVDLDLAPGERVALVGPSGVGKSTVVDLLCGFLPETAWSGAALVGGADVRRVDGEELRRRTVLHVPQDPYLFDASLRANLLLAAPDSTDEELVTALAAVGAGAWLDGLEHGLNTPMGERGARCSGGERQRIGLARAVLARHQQLVLLDEPASHLPADDAVAALRAVLDAAPGRGALVVAHRGTEAALADRIVSLHPPTA